ncbi:MAG: serpin family protein [Lachnospiraceae bacterium]|nr:serpin family protein [Lachnospiraceae bacterium]
MRSFFVKTKGLPRRFAAVALVIAMMTSLFGCSRGLKNAVALAEPESGASSSGVDKVALDGTFYAAYRAYALEMFQLAHKDAGKSFAISPFSVMFALAMVENGASGETLSQMEEMFGMPRDTMNGYLSSLIDQWSKDNGLWIANSVWLNNSVADNVRKQFLDICSKTYRASAFRAPFDGSTVSDINNWVSNNTDGMIRDFVKELDPSLLMMLVNAVLFDQGWEKQFVKDKTQKNEPFYGEDGQQIGEVDLMCETKNGSYYRDELCTSVSKTYEDYDFRFRVYQPREGVSLETLIEALTPEYMRATLEPANQHEAEVTLQLPKFTTDYRCDNMESILMAMGMTEAFNGGLTEIVDGNDLMIDFVIHQVRIEVDEEGTRAAAATGVGVKLSAAPAYPDQITVRLDRPFVYMILAGDNQIPIFMGTYEGK